ncbi:DUF5713 family protein [Acinetobacter sp. GSS19]|uniref:DUF5713 family protein n=1 Tax=Acinetobacter sp. GSS19 TaxID=3020716 RepID=UPI002360C329|nr:DUF5713 family protein [Acinetobacter sp. GSS19]
MLDDLLIPMYDDDYYPDVLVDELKQLLRPFAKQVAKGGLSNQAIYHEAHETIGKINKMKPKFEDCDSSLDDTAADYIAEAMMMVLQEAGYFDIEMEELIANREW